MAESEPDEKANASAVQLESQVSDNSNNSDQPNTEAADMQPDGAGNDPQVIENEDASTREGNHTESVASSTVLSTPVGSSQVDVSSSVINDTNSPQQEILAQVRKIFLDQQQQKAARKNPLKQELARGLQSIDEAMKSTNSYFSLRSIIEPLKLSCETKSVALVTSSLEAITGLLQQSILSQADDGPVSFALMIEVICNCFYGEKTDNKVQAEILRAVSEIDFSEVLSPYSVHDALLLKLVRVTLNIFLYSKLPTNQKLAQSLLDLIVKTVFDRIELSLYEPDKSDVKESTNGVSESKSEPNGSSTKLTLKAMEGRKSLEEDEQADYNPAVEKLHTWKTQERCVRDAFLLFRSFCKLSIKPIAIEYANDIQSEQIRLKMIALHYIYTLFTTQRAIFQSNTVMLRFANHKDGVIFLDACKHYVCLALSKNAFIPISKVFSLCCHLFIEICENMRMTFLAEIGVFLNEIYFPMLELKSCANSHKQMILDTLLKIAREPQIMIEFYLNFDCVRSLDNIFEKMVNVLSRVASMTSTYSNDTLEPEEEPSLSTDLEALAVALNVSHSSLQASSTSSASEYLSSNMAASANSSSSSYFQDSSLDYTLKAKSLYCLVVILNSLTLWAHRQIRAAVEEQIEDNVGSSALDKNSQRFQNSRLQIKSLSDDPDDFEARKQRKTTLQEGIRLFNDSPSKGIEHLKAHGFLKEDLKPSELAEFLLSHEEISKRMIGEYLGEHEEFNLETMHKFIEMISFSNLTFVDALRKLLQKFRLPGEAQKIDRFMLKFAECFTRENPDIISQADTAYVLAYSVIMLNTDQHNKQVRHRMSKQEFINNNKGIDSGKDLPSEYLSKIYDDISQNEIILRTEHSYDSLLDQNSLRTSWSISTAFNNLGRNIQREALIAATEEIALRTSETMQNLQKLTLNTNSTFYMAHRVEHVKPMFEIIWMPILASISTPFQYTDDLNLIKLCLVGMQKAVSLASIFQLDLAINVFVSTLAKYSQIERPESIDTKKLLAAKTLLEIACVDGEHLKTCWKIVLIKLSQLERLQLISYGVDQNDIPTISLMTIKAQKTDTIGENDDKTSIKSFSKKRPSIAPIETPKIFKGDALSRSIARLMDKVFFLSSQLSGTAIIDFVSALCDVSHHEIISSGHSDQPRLYCLQKLIEVAYYNMSRIRMEWSSIWSKIGPHLTQTITDSPPYISIFALDSLRQLSLQFLEIEELPNFKFQQDFLAPFQYAVSNDIANDELNDFAFGCIQQIIQAKAHCLKSGWKTILSLYSVILSRPVAIVIPVYDSLKFIIENYIPQIIQVGCFSELIQTLCQLAKVKNNQKIALHALDFIYHIPKKLSSDDSLLRSDSFGETVCPIIDSFDNFWSAVLFALYDVSLSGVDLEVRSKSLNFLFDLLRTNGSFYSPELISKICEQVLFPLMSSLMTATDASKFAAKDDYYMWISTTFVQAIRDLIDLFQYNPTILSKLFDRFLNLVRVCICQSNRDSDALAKIGSSCLQEFISLNYSTFTHDQWVDIMSLIKELFEETLAKKLLDYHSDDADYLTDRKMSSELVDGIYQEEHTKFTSSQVDLAINQFSPKDHQTKRTMRRKEFQPLIVKCVLQLLLLDMIRETFLPGDILKSLPDDIFEDLRVPLLQSWNFSENFNRDLKLRENLWRLGFMKQLPNLLRQETLSASVLTRLLDRRVTFSSKSTREELLDDKLFSEYITCLKRILETFIVLDGSKEASHLQSWQPVIVKTIEMISCQKSEAAFRLCTESLYDRLCKLLTLKSTNHQIFCSLHSFFTRLGHEQLSLE